MVQNSGPWNLWLPVVKNRRLFAQCAHSVGTAHRAPPKLLILVQIVFETLNIALGNITHGLTH